MIWTKRVPYFLFVGLLFSLPLERIPSAEITILSTNATLRISQVIGFILICSSAQLIYRSKRELLKSPWVWLVAFNALVWLSILGATNLRRAILVAFYTLFVSLLAWVVSLLFQAKYRHVYAITLIAAALFTGMIAIYQFFGDLLGLPIAITGLREQYTQILFGFPRIQSTALEPLFYANFLLIPIGLLMAGIVTERFSRWWLLVLTFLVSLVGLTVSRGAYLGLCVMTLIAVLWAVWIKRYRSIGHLLICIIAAIIIVYTMISAAASINVNKATNSSENTSQLTKQSTNFSTGESAEGRAVARRLGLQAFYEHPFLGVGPGNFGAYARANQPVRFKDDKAVVNNEPIELMAEYGLVGFSIFAIFIINLMLITARSLRESKMKDYFSFGVFIALCGIAVQYQSFSTLYITHVWVAIGLLVGSVKQQADKVPIHG